MARRATWIVVALLVWLSALGVGAQAAGGGPDNVVTTTATADDSTQDRAGVQVGFYGGDDLESTNLANADSHDCTGCRSVAVAVQAVIATGDPSTVSPRNVAVASNENCTSCTTFAFAYQYVVTTDGPVHLTSAQRTDIDDLRAQFRDLADSDLSPTDLDARLHDLADQFRAEINQDVRASGQTPHGHTHLREDG
jgi:hypothetical protein